jgi:alpha-N-arabinofuranosidase
MNRILINPEHSTGALDPNVFGGFAEHLERCVYGGMYDPESPLADERGLRTDVLEAMRRLKMPVIRYPGGNFVSGYRWLDGVGPRSERPVRLDMAWNSVETNAFGTNEFIEWCRLVNTEPYLVVNSGDGDMREARDWVEYCNGARGTTLARLRQQHGYEQPHNVKYWGIGNEVDGPWQIGYKTPQEYARVATEFGKVMKWVDPSIKLIVNGVSNWGAGDFVERGQLLLEQAAHLIDYLAIHWYVDNDTGDFARYMALSELFEQRLSAYEGLIRAVRVERKIERPIYIAVDEWNVWHRNVMSTGGHDAVIYNLEDALVVAAQLNAFLRHAASVRMANIAQIVNVLAPIYTTRDGMLLQTIFYPFALFSNLAGAQVVQSHYNGDTFSAGDYAALPLLDVTATLSADGRQLVVFAINRSEQAAVETAITLALGQFAGPVQVHCVNGADIKARNTFDEPEAVRTTVREQAASGREITVAFEPHSVTALVCPLA